MKTSTAQRVFCSGGKKGDKVSSGNCCAISTLITASAVSRSLIWDRSRSPTARMSLLYLPPTYSTTPASLPVNGYTHPELARLLPAFAAAYTALYPWDKTWEGKVRQRQGGGGAKGGLPQMADKLLFILVYQKTNPLQTLHGLQFGLSQPQTHYWIHHLLPVVQQALADLALAPERDASRVATNPLTWEGAPALAIDGTERRRQRPTAATQQRAHYSGKKKAHTDKNILLVNELSGKVVYLGPTVAGKTHDKKAAEETPITYPRNATLDKDTGFQGYQPAGVLTAQPKKNPAAKN